MASFSRTPASPSTRHSGKSSCGPSRRPRRSREGWGRRSPGSLARAGSAVRRSCSARCSGPARACARGRHAERVCLGQRTGFGLSSAAILLFQPGQVRIRTCPLHALGDKIDRPLSGESGQAVSEILDHIERRTAAHHANPGHVIGRVEQVFAMVRRVHEAIMNRGGVAPVGHVFRHAIEAQGAVGRQPVGECRFVRELVG